MRYVPYILFSLLSALTSCETTQYFTVENQVPGEVIFPVASPRVVVVNNAALQPPDNGIEYLAGNKERHGYALSKDSAYQTYALSLGEALDATGYFEEVMIYNKPVREDGIFLLPQRINPLKAKKIADDVDADALIVADRLLFYVSQRILGHNAYFSSIEVVCQGDFSVFSAEKGEITHTFSIVDSLKFNDYVGSDTTLFLRQIPASLLLTSAKRMAGKVSRKCAPHWEYSERLFYTTADSQMKTAYAYAQKGRWQQAVECWTAIYRNAGNKQKGRAAINIATAEELYNSYTSALSWINKALEAYAKEKPGKVKNEVRYALEYRERVEKLRNNLLNLQ